MTVEPARDKGRSAVTPAKTPARPEKPEPDNPLIYPSQGPTLLFKGQEAIAQRSRAAADA